jgi:histidinol-phosphatase (PHP family)
MVVESGALVDSHVHTNYSDDSTMRPEDAVKQARLLGLNGIALTDHYDIDFPDKQYLFEFDVTKRAECIKMLHQTYGHELEIVEGIELGVQPHVVDACTKLIDSHSFDFVICSIHAVDQLVLYDSDGAFYEERTKEQAYRRYLEEIYSIVRIFDRFDVLGHLGHIRRYGPYEIKSMPYKYYDDIIDSIFKTLIDHGKGIEVNTSGYTYHLGTVIPDVDIINRYKELGGEIITLGSDAHDKGSIAKSFKQGYAALKRAGFKYVNYFKNRKPIAIPLR